MIKAAVHALLSQVDEVLKHGGTVFLMFLDLMTSRIAITTYHWLVRLITWAALMR